MIISWAYISKYSTHTNIPSTKEFSMSLSDHEMIACTRKINTVKYKGKTIKCRNYKDYQSEKIIVELQKTNWENLCRCNGVNIAVLYFDKVLTEMYEQSAPLIEKRIRGKPCQWIEANIKIQMNDRDKALRQARKSNLPADWQTYKNLRNKCNNKLKQAKLKYYKNLLDENRFNPKRIWKIIKEIYPNKCNNISVTTFTTKNESEVANELCIFFSNITFLSIF